LALWHAAPAHVDTLWLHAPKKESLERCRGGKALKRKAEKRSGIWEAEKRTDSLEKEMPFSGFS